MITDNQFDLATKIKNIELTFPDELTGIDPHLKHLLRRMLAKDHRTRIDLESIVVDDWVTSEGSQPFFSDEDYYGSGYSSTGQFDGTIPEKQYPRSPIDRWTTSEIEAASLKVLIVDTSLVTRRMLSQQIKSLKECFCCSAANEEEAFELIRSVNVNQKQTFDYIFIGFDSSKRFGCNVVKEIRDLNYKNKILGITHSSDLNSLDIITLLKSGVDAIVMKPIANDELNKILSEDVKILIEAQQTTESATRSLELTKEEMDASIISIPPTYSSSSINNEFDVALLLSSPSTVDSKTSIRTNISTKRTLELDLDDNDDLHMKDFQSYLASNSSVSKDSVVHGSGMSLIDTPQPRSYSLKPNGGSFTNNKTLIRKRGFMVVPYGSPENGEDVTYADRPLKILSLSKKDDNRKNKREAAMTKSQLAYQYHLAKRNGDVNTMSTSKNQFTVLRNQSRNNLLKFNSRNYSFSRSASKSISMSQSDSSRADSDITLFATSGFNTSNNNLTEATPFEGRPSSRVDTPVSLLKDELHARSFNFEDELEAASVSITDSDGDGIVKGSLAGTDDDDDDDNDDDFGASTEIKQLDDAALNDLFDELIFSKPINKSDEIQDWNHIMVCNCDILAENVLYNSEHQFNKELGVTLATSENIVSRCYMEDRVYINANEKCNWDNHRTLSIAAVFDGHDGDYAAQLLKDKFADRFKSFLSNVESNFDTDEASNHMVPHEEKICQVFDHTFAHLDREILEKDYIRQQKNIKNGNLEAQSFAGSVTVTMAIMPFKPSGMDFHQLDCGPLVEVFIAHVGDCRAVLSNDGFL